MNKFTLIYYLISSVIAIDLSVFHINTMSILLIFHSNNFYQLQLIFSTISTAYLNLTFARSAAISRTCLSGLSLLETHVQLLLEVNHIEAGRRGRRDMLHPELVALGPLPGRQYWVQDLVGLLQVFRVQGLELLERGWRVVCARGRGRFQRLGFRRSFVGVSGDQSWIVVSDEWGGWRDYTHFVSLYWQLVRYLLRSLVW